LVFSYNIIKDYLITNRKIITKNKNIWKKKTASFLFLKKRDKYKLFLDENNTFDNKSLLNNSKDIINNKEYSNSNVIFSANSQNMINYKINKSDNLNINKYEQHSKTEADLIGKIKYTRNYNSKNTDTQSEKNYKLSKIRKMNILDLKNIDLSIPLINDEKNINKNKLYKKNISIENISKNILSAINIKDISSTKLLIKEKIQNFLLKYKSRNGKRKEKNSQSVSLKSKNSFCSKNCFDDNQSEKFVKKCYHEGKVNNCFGCKYKKVVTTEIDKKLENICIIYVDILSITQLVFTLNLGIKIKI